jgi:NADH-quinone oxidoreductase subunit F
MYCEHNVELIPDSSAISSLPEGVCPVDWAKTCVDIARENNCGQSVMCRDGMTQLQAIISDLVRGKGESEDIELIRDLATVISQSKGCEIAEKTAKNVLFSLDNYADEWDAHCRRKRCSALVCKSYYSVYIDPAVCDGCGNCIKNAPEGAIAGGDGLISVVQDDSELKDSEFAAVCPKGAIKRCGAVKPRLPEAPVPVGSFSAEGGGRRRRRG